jgi:hypothetical protein
VREAREYVKPQPSYLSQFSGDQTAAGAALARRTAAGESIAARKKMEFRDQESALESRF